jgi:hypothetical protein
MHSVRALVRDIRWYEVAQKSVIWFKSWHLSLSLTQRQHGDLVSLHVPRSERQIQLDNAK